MKQAKHDTGGQEDQEAETQETSCHKLKSRDRANVDNDVPSIIELEPAKHDSHGQEALRADPPEAYDSECGPTRNRLGQLGTRLLRWLKHLFRRD